MNRLSRLLRRVGDRALVVVAAPYRRRALVLDTAGGVCLVIGAALFSPRAAWLVAAAWLILRATGIERRAS